MSKDTHFTSLTLLTYLTYSLTHLTHLTPFTHLTHHAPDGLAYTGSFMARHWERVTARVQSHARVSFDVGITIWLKPVLWLLWGSRFDWSQCYVIIVLHSAFVIVLSVDVLDVIRSAQVSNTPNIISSRPLTKGYARESEAIFFFSEAD